MAAAATTTTTATTAGESARGSGGIGASCREDGKLDRGFFAGALGTGDFLLLVNDDFFEVLVAGIADVFVDGHSQNLSRKVPSLAPRRKPKLYRRNVRSCTSHH